MKISTRGRYAIRMLIDIAQQSTDKPVPLKDISERQGISKKYLEQIVLVLTKTGLLKTVRGYQGGYLLGKNAEDITVYDVLAATEGAITPVACAELPENCPRSGDCKSLYIWQGLNKVMIDYLKSITVADAARHG